MLVPLRYLPHGFVELLSIERGSLLMRHPCCVFTRRAATQTRQQRKLLPSHSPCGTMWSVVVFAAAAAAVAVSPSSCFLEKGEAGTLINVAELQPPTSAEFLPAAAACTLQITSSLKTAGCGQVAAG